MKIVIAPDSFKGSMSSKDIIDIVKNVALETISPVEVVGVPIADGGEGTIEAVVFANDGDIVHKTITDPLGKKVDAYYGVVGDTAIIEMALCSGLTMVDEFQRDPKKTTSYGTGEMIQHVLDDGFRNIVIGIGGSATDDGGTGAMEALGVRYINNQGKTMTRMCGEKLKDIDVIDISQIDERIRECSISVMCDVNNPLTGEFGATYVYGAQKGGSAEDLDFLEQGMIRYETLINALFDADIGHIEGAGAAGGMGAAMTAYLEAKLVSGIEAVLEIARFDQKIKNADFIITGEGRVDAQSASGKVIHGVTDYANKQNIPVIVIAGGVGEGLQAVYDLGVKVILTLPNKPMSLEACMKDTKELLEELSLNLFNVIKIGKNIDEM